MLRFDLPAVSSNVIRWEAVITFVVCNLALFVSPWFMAVLVVQALVVRINRVVYSLFDKSNFVVSRRGLSYLMICEV